MSKQKYYEIIPEKTNLESFSYMQSSRTKIIREMSKLLDDETRKMFQHFHFVIVSTDRLVDRNKKRKEIFLKFVDLTKKTWKGEKISSLDEYESSAIELIEGLKKMKEEGFSQADYVFSDIQELFWGEFKDASRRGKILTTNELQTIRLGVSKGQAAIYLHLLFPWLERKAIEQIALKYGLAVKIADDIIDWCDDILWSFINISKEDIKNVHGITIRNDFVEYVDGEKLTLENGYIKREIEKINDLFREADKLLEEIVPKNTAREIFKDFMYSWLLECKAKYIL